MWVIDSGSLRHNAGERKQLTNLSRGSSTHKVKFGDINNYLVEGIGYTSIKLEYGGNFHLNEILYAPILKRNLLSNSCLEDKGNRIALIDGKVVVLAKGSSIENVMTIWIHEGRFYRLLTPPPQYLEHINI